MIADRLGYNASMSDVTRILTAMELGVPAAADQLLPLVYEELRKLAAAKLAKEKPGQTLQPTVLVHEAYLRLVVGDQARRWNGRGHFFGAAAEAMRRILIENARRKRSQKHGGETPRLDLDMAAAAAAGRHPGLASAVRAGSATSGAWSACPCTRPSLSHTQL